MTALSETAFPVPEVAAPYAEAMSPAGDLRRMEVSRSQQEADIEALVAAFDAGGMAAAQGLYAYRDDTARMEFGRRRRAQLFELGWIV